MNKHRLENYLNNAGSLVPEDSLMGEYSNVEWWTACKDHFDDLIWLYYADRTVFLTARFPYDPEFPDRGENIEKTVNNIKRSFAIYLKSNDYKYSHLYKTITLEYDPLYNVDGYEEIERVLDQTGTVEDIKSGSDTTSKSGNDSLEYLGTESVNKSGNEKVDYAGKEGSTRTGSESNEKSGSNTKTISKTTYDSATFYDTEKEVETPAQFKDTKTYTNVKDEKEFTNRSDTHSYNNVKDEKSFLNRKDQQNYDSSVEVEYGSGNLNSRDLNDTERTKIRRYGNIGVTSSQNLLEQERNAALFDFYKTVVNDCVNLITYAVD